MNNSQRQSMLLTMSMSILALIMGLTVGYYTGNHEGYRDGYEQGTWNMTLHIKTHYPNLQIYYPCFGIRHFIIDHPKWSPQSVSDYMAIESVYKSTEGGCNQ